jgi:hypothetical protein
VPQSVNTPVPRSLPLLLSNDNHDTTVSYDPEDELKFQAMIARGKEAVRKAKAAEQLQQKYGQEAIRKELRRRGVDPDTGERMTVKKQRKHISKALGSRHQLEQSAKARRERKKQRKHRNR